MFTAVSKNNLFLRHADFVRIVILPDTVGLYYMSLLDRLTSYLAGKNALTQELKVYIAEFKAIDVHTKASEAVFPWEGKLVDSFDRGYCEWLLKQNSMMGRSDRMGETISKCLADSY